MKHSACFSTWRSQFAIEGVKWVNLSQLWFCLVEVHYFLQVTDQPPGSEPTQMMEVTFQLLIATSVPKPEISIIKRTENPFNKEVWLLTTHWSEFTILWNCSFLSGIPWHLILQETLNFLGFICTFVTLFSAIRNFIEQHVVILYF